MKTFQPRISCPLLAGKYIATNTTVDLTTFSRIPSEGWIWIVTVKSVSGEGKNKKLAMCLNVEVKISRSRERRKKT